MQPNGYAAFLSVKKTKRNAIYACRSGFCGTQPKISQCVGNTADPLATSWLYLFNKEKQTRRNKKKRSFGISALKRTVSRSLK